MPALQIGSKVGSYEILALVGVGGMGEVYRARDSKLKRDVAIKALPAEFSRDPERLARAQREAELLASLNHPNIAQIYGQEEAGGALCLVLEFVEGDTIQDRIQRGPIPVDDAIEIARQISAALEAAHERGVVHRDLKPANVKITPSGQVKVLDFGLAKLRSDDSSGSALLTNSPTMAPGGTLQGVILGTAAYMAPEQAKGKDADARSDIWAFGVVLFEMLSGKSVFAGDTMVEVLGGVLKSDPEWHALPATTPPAVRALLRRCLQKDRKRRLHHIADARIEIEEALHEPATPAATMAPAGNSRERLLWMGAVVMAIVLGAAASILFRPAPPPTPETRLQIVTEGGNPFAFAISPDGRRVVFAGADGKLWLRPLESETGLPLAGTEGGSRPFWAPDGRSIGFFAGQKLKRVDSSGGTAQTLADAPLGGSGAWSPEGTILFATRGALSRVSSGGGTPVEATRLAESQQSHLFPAFLPDGRYFLFFAQGDQRGVYVGSLDGNDIRRLFDAETFAAFVPPDHVLFGRGAVLLAQRLDLDNLTVIGEPFRVADQIMVSYTTPGEVALSASMAGPFAYRRAAEAVEYQLTWFDRSGKRLSAVGNPDTAQPIQPRSSPDGRSVALSRTVNGNRDIWLLEVERGVLQRFTSDAGREGQPVWSPDGTRLVFFADRETGVYDLYAKAANGVGPEQLLLRTPESKNPFDWSPDGKFILYASQSARTGRDLWVLPLAGDKKPFPVAQTSFEESSARFSPDGRWISYSSNESGRSEIYVQPFPGPGRKVQVSTDGGITAHWRGNGREIFYTASGGRRMAVPVALEENGVGLKIGGPTLLFTIETGADAGVLQDNFQAMPDGQRFLVNVPTDTPPAVPITVVLNWAGGRR